MNKEIREIAKLRNLVLIGQVSVAKQIETVDATEEGQQLQSLQEMLFTHRKELAVKEGMYKEDCVKEHEKSGEKDFPGGKIRNFVDVKYDEEDAVVYAIANDLPKLLKTQPAKYKAFLKAVEPDEVGSITSVPKMTLASDLSGFLG